MSSTVSFTRRGLLFVAGSILATVGVSFLFPAATAQGVYYLPTTVYLTSGTSWTVPSGWNSSNNTVEVVGGGAGAGANTADLGGGGGGGGAYSKATNVALTPGSSVTYAVGSGGGGNTDGGDTYFCNSTSNCASISGTAVIVGAKGGTHGTGITAGIGGSAASGYPAGASCVVGAASMRCSGGNGGAGGTGTSGNSIGGGGGGGGAGPGGAGKSGGAGYAGASGTGGGGGGGGGGSSTAGTAGANGAGGPGGSGPAGSGGGSAGAIGSNGGGGGGGNQNGSGGAGGAGTEWDSTHGSGGGGGGAGDYDSAGAPAGGALYGGGAGGAGEDYGGTQATGGKGIVVITYLSSSGTPVTISASASTAGPLYAGDSVTYTISRNGPTSYQAVSVDVTLGGTAVQNTDYTVSGLTSGKATIPANSLSTTVTVTVLSNIASNKTFSFTLPASSNYNLSSPSAFSLNMAPSASSLSLNAYFYTDTAVNVSWSAQFANSCTVTGPNSFSASGLSGTRTTTPGTSPAQYVLTCSTPQGTKYATSTAVSDSSLGSLKNGLKGYWSFDAADINTPTALDVSPNACYPGTLTNAPTPTTGRWGETNNALSFNGTSQYIDLGTNTFPTTTTQTFSVSAWVYTDLSQASYVISRDVDSANKGWLVKINTDKTVEVGYVDSAGTYHHDASSAAPLTANAWHHIVAIYNFSTLTRSLYVDGTSYALTSNTLGTLYSSVSTASIRIGADRYGYMKGKIDEVMLYNRALSASEVSTLYNLSAHDAASIQSSGVRPSTTGIAPTLETVSGYVAASFSSTFPLPAYYDPLSGSSGNSTGDDISAHNPPLQPYPLLSDVSSKWYAGTPAPVVCGATAQGAAGNGSCLYFGDKKGTHVAAITTTKVYDIATTTSGLDLVSTNPVDECGVATTHWSYVQTGTNTLLVPKYTSLTATYLCQPNQEYVWRTNRDYGCWPGSCNASTIQQRVFRFADRAKVNGGGETSALHTTQSQTVSSATTLTLQCGGYVPEDGTEVGLRPVFPDGTDGFPASKPIDDFNDYTSQGTFAVQPDPLSHTIGLPPYYGLGRASACWTYCYWPWTYAYYNAASSTFYQPATTLNVNVCSGDNEIVSGGVCTPCPSGQYRSGNSCSTTPPPTATIQANGAGFKANGHDGNKISVAVGSSVVVTATYATSSGPGTDTATSFTSNGTFNVPSNATSVKVLVVAGGGGGGGKRGGGGGGGGVIYNSSYSVTPNASVAVTVGSGGAAGSGGGSGGAGGNGGNSIFGTLTAIGGGGGGGSGSKNGKAGGSGGGADGSDGSAGTPGTGTAGQGYNGGNGKTNSGGGGGGGGAVGSDAPANPTGGNGGGGYSSSITGIAAYYAGGGGGGGSNSGADSVGGSGGGGAGHHNTAGVAGTANTGGGGGGGGDNGSTGLAGGAGGSGVVIVSYLQLDSLTATAINDDSTSASVDCSKVVGDVSGNGNANCWNIADTQKVYTFTANTAGTTTYSAQIKTTNYPYYNSYATVEVVVCQVGETPDGVGGCSHTDQCTNNADFPGQQPYVPVNATQQAGMTCTCDPGYTPSGGLCSSVPPSNLVLTVNPSRVRAGNTTSLTWTGSNLPTTPGACVLTASPAVVGTPMDLTSGSTGSTAAVSVGPIDQTTLLTITCTSGAGSNSANKVIGTIPVYEEI